MFSSRLGSRTDATLTLSADPLGLSPGWGQPAHTRHRPDTRREKGKRTDGKSRRPNITSGRKVMHHM
ncbi:hypothetical protein BDV93DRAFT_521821 [Ceratobasidium sp. AG-I]|nr:hypothetical protein BDV93DRAFT_521821 [Ceratobasidium sp. AG-I]